MRSFLRKPYVYTAIFATVLSLFFLYTILLVFTIPRTMEQNEFEPDSFVGTVDNSWGNNTPTEPKDTDASGGTTDGTTNGGVTEPSAPETELFETDPDATYPIITDTLYMDESIRIEITQLRRYDSDLYVADVRIKDPSLLKTALARDKDGNEFGMNIKEKTSVIGERVGAILAVNGDFYGSNESGYVIRNGIIYRDTIRPANGSGSDLAYFDDLAIMRDGTFVTFDEKDYSAREVWEKGAMHVLTFGPTLVKGGEIAVDKDTEVGLAWSGQDNPRCAIGYVSEGHYLFIVVDGRCDASHGTSLWELADVFCELGAVTAYNLDGGGSATMIFNGRLINTPYTNWNKPSGERRVSDIVYIGY